MQSHASDGVTTPSRSMRTPPSTAAIHVLILRPFTLRTAISEYVRTNTADADRRSMDVDGLRRYRGQSPAMKLAATTKTTMTMMPTMNHA